MVINNKEYVLPEMNFGTLCMLERMGAPINALATHPLSAVRAFLALAMDCDVEKAGRELQAHLVSGGTLDELLDEVVYAMEDADFFQDLAQ